MLAIYLAAPEVDNDRRALNVFHGMRRAKKEGRWLGHFPIGYTNTRDDKNKPIIVPEGGFKKAIIKKAFAEFSTGLFNIEELRRKLYKEGLKLTKNAFAAVLKNKTYIGKIFVRAYKDEPAQWVEGIHQSIIDENIFYEVQDVLTGRKRNVPNKIHEKFKFKDNQVRTPKVNEVIDRICSKIKGSKGNKKGQQSFYELLPCRVELLGKTTNRIPKDLETILFKIRRDQEK